MYAFYSDVVLKHETPIWHPEQPKRAVAVIDGLRLGGAEVVEPPIRSDVLDIIKQFHDPTYVEMVLDACKIGNYAIDQDTYVSGGTCDAALFSASAVITAVSDAAKYGEVYVVTRPPGHHAGIKGKALGAPTQGFCIFNNAAIGALYFGDGAAVLDIDVHHGNGTQEMLYDKPILYISLHQDPRTLYPGTGFLDEVGEGRGEGFNINLPLMPGTGDDIYMDLIDRVVVPVLKQYGAKLVIVSLGWDAHMNDPLAQLKLSINSYVHVARSLRELGVPIIYVLEGGYNYSVLRDGSKALATKMVVERKSTSEEVAYRRFYKVQIKYIRSTIGKYWRIDI